MVACSPSHVDGTNVYRARFIDAESEIRAHHSARAAKQVPRAERRRTPYQFPRPQTGAAPRGTSTIPPESCCNFSRAAGRSSGPRRLEIGSILLFNHLTAHKFTQKALLEGRAQARTQVPLGWTRTSEYPTLVAPWLHGESHQSREECLAACATGKPPERWPHVYTGNVAAKGATMFRPALPALPAAPSTALARVLTGVDKFDAAPCATAWLLHELPGRLDRWMDRWMDGWRWIDRRVHK